MNLNFAITRLVNSGFREKNTLTHRTIFEPLLLFQGA